MIYALGIVHLYKMRGGGKKVRERETGGVATGMMEKVLQRRSCESERGKIRDYERGWDWKKGKCDDNTTKK